MNVYLIDGTYELFRHFFALPSRVTKEGLEVAATQGVVGSVIGMVESGVTHLGVATDHIIESFRNDLWPGYKTSAGVDARLLDQFPILEETLTALGVVVWPMVDLEADDALAAAAVASMADPDVERIYICSPDKDLAQCILDDRVVQLDRRSGKVTNEAGVVAKFGVAPDSIPDFLALVGDSADGYPGLPGWGAKSAAAVLARYGRLESIPEDYSSWDVLLRGGGKLATILREQRRRAYLFRDLATLRTDARLFGSVDALRWTGPTNAFWALCERIEARQLWERVSRLPLAQGSV